jgi:hypothetical protein
MFPAPGKWTCVARAFGGASRPPSDDVSAWSAPVSAQFRTDPSLVAPLRVADGTAPGFVLAGKLNRAAAGGVLTLRLTRTPECPSAVVNEITRARVQANGSFRLKMHLAVRSSHRGKLDLALWRADASYGGTRLVRPDRHFGEVFLGRSVGFVPGIGFLKPPAGRRLMLYTGGHCVDFA